MVQGAHCARIAPLFFRIFRLLLCIYGRKPRLRARLVSSFALSRPRDRISQNFFRGKSAPRGTSARAYGKEKLCSLGPPSLSRSLSSSRELTLPYMFMQAFE